MDLGSPFWVTWGMLGTSAVGLPVHHGQQHGVRTQSNILYHSSQGKPGNRGLPGPRGTAGLEVGLSLVFCIY